MYRFRSQEVKAAAEEIVFKFNGLIETFKLQEILSYKREF